MTAVLSYVWATKPCSAGRQIHDRIPLILAPADYTQGLNDELARHVPSRSADVLLTNLRGLSSIDRKNHTGNKFRFVGVQKQRGMGDVPSGAHFGA